VATDSWNTYGVLSLFICAVCFYSRPNDQQLPFYSKNKGTANENAVRRKLPLLGKQVAPMNDVGTKSLPATNIQQSPIHIEYVEGPQSSL
jgi:hypothetical protein